MQELPQQRVLAGLQRLGRALEHDAAIGDGDHLVADRQGLVHVVADDDAGQAQAVVEALDQAHDHPRGDRVEPGQRLVVDHQRRVQGQRAGQCHAARHAAGQLARPRIGGGEQAHRMQLHLHQLAQYGGRQAGVRAQRQRHVLGHGEVGQQAIALQQHAHALAHFQQRAAVVRDRPAEQGDVAGDRAQFAVRR
ncbi:hypothetical protein G6F23_014121 [Rhizopus arrhizus]|nr:hypothetical protein G6F23_014121 [Rhizopus arrhizus]